MLLVQTARRRGPALTDWQQEALQEIGVAVERMVTLTEDLLDVTSLQMGRLRLQRTPTNLVSLAQRAASLFQKATTRHQIEVRPAGEQLMADIDPGRIEQVLNNLIGNAIKYSPQGGPITVSLWEDADGGVVGVSMRDRGIGIPASQQGLVFGRFMRADNAAAWGIGGSGLWLYISRELVERHEGRLWFESAEREGSTFHVGLPAIYEAAQAARGAGQVSQWAPARARQDAADAREKAT
jgi:signal transduction histidine kinase